MNNDQGDFWDELWGCVFGIVVWGALCGGLALSIGALVRTLAL